MRARLIKTGMASLAALTFATQGAAPAHAQLSLGGLPGNILNGVRTAQKIGDALHKIDEPEEIKMGGDLAAMLLGASPLVDDPAMQHHVNQLGKWLALHSERPNLPWQFGVIESDDYNAFSTPGGYVLISRGLLESMRNESELAGVLAHEIAHVVKRHHVEALQSSLRSEALGSMNDYFGATDSIGGAGGAFAGALFSAGREMYTKGLDKEDEFEADRMGAVIAARSGFSPYGLAGVLQTLTSVSNKSKGFSLLFSTHPNPANRMQKLAEAMGTRLDGYTVVEDLPGSEAFRFSTPPAEETAGESGADDALAAADPEHDTDAE